MIFTTSLLLSLLAFAEDKDRVYFVDASLEPEGELLGGRFLDVDGDGKFELCLVVDSDGERELRLHRVQPGRIDPEPYRSVVVKDDVVAFAFADVREDLVASGSGRDELLFMTKDGFYSYSLERKGYRGNIKRLIRDELLFDVANPDRLPEWRFVLPSQWGDRVLVPGKDGVSVWGPGPGAVAIDAASSSDAGAMAGFVSLGRFPGAVGAGHVTSPEEYEHGDEDEDHDHTTVSVGSSGVRIQVTPDADTLLMPAGEDEAFQLLTSERSYGAPALTDVDRDGNADLLFAVGKELRIHFSRAEGFSETADRIEVFPAYLDREGSQPTLFLRDLDGDGDTDIVAEMSEEQKGLENTETSLFCLINDGERLLPEDPHQLLRFKAAYLRIEFADIDGDGRLDLALRKFELPSMLESVTGFEFTLTHLVFLGQQMGTPFERKPCLRQSRSYDETNFQDIIANRELDMDCDGDGISDLVEVDLKGRIAIRRLKHTSSFFGGDSWKLESTPWKRFEVYGNVESVSVKDVNGDGVGDVISEGEKAMTVLLSQRRTQEKGR